MNVRKRRVIPTFSGRTTFICFGGVPDGADLLVGETQYALHFPASFFRKLIADLAGSKLEIGNFKQNPAAPGTLNDYIQRTLRIAQTPGTYVAALLIEDGYAERIGNKLRISSLPSCRSMPVMG
jgi:hypothetical protein